MNGIWPYAGWVSADGGWRLWGLAGYGEGRVVLTEDGTEAEESGMSMAGAALGATRELWQGGGTVLQGRAEASLAQVGLDGNAADGGSLGAMTVDTRRVRLGLEASRGIGLAGGRSLSLSLSAGGRRDFEEGGGAALEIGPGLRYADPSLGLFVEGSGHVLAAASDAAREWGLAFTAGFDPRIRGRGLALRLDTGYGATGGGAFGLWERQVAEAAASPSGGSGPEPRLEARMEYGLPAPPGLLTPYWSYAVVGDGQRSYRLGGRWDVDEWLRVGSCRASGWKVPARTGAGSR